MPNIYKTFTIIGFKVCFYDKIKYGFMPYNDNKYKGLDYYWRVAASSTLCMALGTLFTYPLDLIHTRMSADMTKKGQSKLFSTTFDTFNRTHLDEGRRGLYKGVELTCVTAIIRASLTLPVYDTFKKYS